MKTTLEIPDELFRRTKATAAMQGDSLKDFVVAVLQEHLDRQTAGPSAPRGWQRVFGQARQEEIEAVDAIVAEEFERVEPDDWR
jgi:hypothetical protein